MTRLFDYILAQDDPFEFVYEALSGMHGVEARDTLQELYNDVSIDRGVHPDDDFETIIEFMIEFMEK